MAKARAKIKIRYNDNIPPVTVDTKADGTVYMRNSSSETCAIKKIVTEGTETKIFHGYGKWSERTTLANYVPVDKDILVEVGVGTEE
jgi:hypothetical protein